MNRKLIEIITQQTKILFDNVQITFDSISDDQLENMISDVPLWKHIYHMLHSLDQWFIDPNNYREPDLNIPDFNSLYKKTEKKLTKTDLIRYFETIKEKLDIYLESLFDDSLNEYPQGCRFTKLTLILAQYRHLMYHIGFIHCYLLFETGKWPNYVGLSPPVET